MFDPKLTAESEIISRKLDELCMQVPPSSTRVPDEDPAFELFWEFESSRFNCDTVLAVAAVSRITGQETSHETRDCIVKIHFKRDLSPLIFPPCQLNRSIHSLSRAGTD